MSAESMLFNGAILCITVILRGLRNGFLIIKNKGRENE